MGGVVKERSRLLPRCSRGPACKVPVHIHEGKIVCFRVVCWYFVDATEERRQREGGMLCCDGRHMHASVPLVCGGAPEGNICPSPGLTVSSKHEAFGGPLLFVSICISFLCINKDLAI